MYSSFVCSIFVVVVAVFFLLLLFNTLFIRDVRSDVNEQLHTEIYARKNINVAIKGYVSFFILIKILRQKYVKMENYKCMDLHTKCLDS